MKTPLARFRRLAVAGVLLAAAVYPAAQPSLEKLLATHGGTHLWILWDGGAAPAGWSIVSAYDGMFPRGEAPANALQTGGGGAHTPTFNLTISQPSATNTSGGSNPVIASTSHSHDLSAPMGVGAASNNDEPEYRSLKLIQYDAGIPTDIPAGGIVFFDGDPGIPDNGWTRVSAQDAKFVKIDSSVGTGGSDSHTHSLTWPSLLASTGGFQAGNVSPGSAAPGVHTHTAPASPTGTSSVTTLPPYIEPLLAKANSNTVIPIGMIGMFDGDPGGNSGFTIRSSSGGDFYEQFVRPASSYNGSSQGSATHTHSNVQGVTGSSGSTTGNTVLVSSGVSPHTHTMTLQFDPVENLPQYVNVVYAERTGASMLLFWDGGAAPAGWSLVEDFDGRFPRGDSPGSYGATGGQNSHNHSMDAVTFGAPASLTNLGGGGSASLSTHTHSVPTSTSSTATNGNIPAYKNLQLIKYDGGVPNIIPEDSIAIFDSSPGKPNDWTAVSAYDNKVVRIDSSAGGEGGSDTHTHGISFSGNLGTSSGSIGRSCTVLICNQTVANASHTHTVPSSSTSDPAPNIPPYVQVVLARADSNTPTLSVGLTAMFDADPGGGWVIRSDTGGPFHQKFLRGGATYDESPGLGADGHTPTGGAVTSDAASATTDRDNLGGFNNLATANHTHAVTPHFTDYTTDSLYTGNNDYFLPPYFNIVVAEKVNLILEDYRWFVDPGETGPDDEDVTDPWSTADIPEDTEIASLPVINDAPGPGRELRLRMQIRINGNNLSANAIELKLQYKAESDGSCTTDTWTDVGASGSGSVWRYASSSVSDGLQLTQSRFVAPSDILQMYIRSASSGTNLNSAILGQSVEYDFHIEHNGALDATKYSFRVLESNGILLSQYDYCPTLTTRPGTDNFMRHGNFFEGSTERGFYWAD